MVSILRVRAPHRIPQGRKLVSALGRSTEQSAVLRTQQWFAFTDPGILIWNRGPRSTVHCSALPLLDGQDARSLLDHEGHFLQCTLRFYGEPVLAANVKVLF